MSNIKGLGDRWATGSERLNTGSIYTQVLRFINRFSKGYMCRPNGFREHARSKNEVLYISDQYKGLSDAGKAEEVQRASRGKDGSGAIRYGARH